MPLVCIILDSRPDYLTSNGCFSSLLAMPLGCGTILGALTDAASDAGSAGFFILPTFRQQGTYERDILRSAPAGTKVVGPDVGPMLLREYEPSDHMLVVDPRSWPVGGFDISGIVEQSKDSRSIVHWVAVPATREGTEERVHCDDNGQVLRISRCYNEVTCSRIDAVAQSLVPLATSLDGVRIDSLGNLRTALSDRGMLSRDVPLPTGRTHNKKLLRGVSKGTSKPDIEGAVSDRVLELP